MAPLKIIAFAEARRVLAERFPEAVLPRERAWRADWTALDAAGGLPLACVSEVCGEVASGRMFLHRVLATVRQRDEWAGVVEAGCSFDFQSARGIGWGKVLVVCAADAGQAVKAADLLVRDANLPLVLLDLQTAPRRSLGRIPASTWHRFRQLTERSGTGLVVLTPQPIVEAARTRIVLRGRWDLAALTRPRRELIDELDVQIFRRGRQVQPTHEALSRSA